MEETNKDDYTYEMYKKGVNTFWRDVPCFPKYQQNRRYKRNYKKTFFIFNQKFKIETACSSSRKRKVIQAKRKKKSIEASFDGGWQKRGSGWNYNSNTGHATFIGKETGKVLSFELRSKTCKICEFHLNRKETVREHECQLNWHGSSKSMETDMAVSMAHRLKDDECDINVIHADNDTATSARLEVEFENIKKKDDQNHVMKGISTSLYNISKSYKELQKDETKVYILRCFMYSIKGGDNEDDIKIGLQRIVPHIFGSHENCKDADWCSYHQDPEKFTYKSLPNGKPLKSEGLKVELNNLVQKMIGRSNSLNDLGSTQSNESFNQLVSVKAPKSRHYGGSCSLQNRLSAAVLQKNEGYGYLSKFMAAERQSKFFIHSKVNICKDEENETSMFDRTEAHSRTGTPLYLKRLNKSTELVFVDLISMDSLLSFISNLEIIAKKDILAMFYGRVMNANLLQRIQPYDHLEVLVKGRGGMLDASVSQVSETSSEKEVMEWLKNIIGLTEVEFSKFPSFKFLNGDSLFTYVDARPFQTDLNIPIGLARKILIFKNNQYLDASNDGDIVKWNVYEVQTFIKEIFPPQSPEVDEICKIIVELYIDGSVMLSYKDHSELKNDLENGEDTLGIICKRIFDSFNHEAKKNTTTFNSNVPSYTQPKSQETEHISITQGKAENVQPHTKLKTLSADWISFLSEKLHLYPTAKGSVEESSTTKSCNLNFFHCDWTNRNILEHRLIFFILSDDGDFDTESAKKSVWNRIRKNMTLWQTHFSKRSKDFFGTSKKDDTLVHKKQAFTLSKSPLKMRFLMEKPLSEISDIENTFLLISKSVLQKDVHSYTSLLERPYVKKGDFLNYSFSLNPEHTYWLFGHQDFSRGFKMRNLPRNVCGQMHDDYLKTCHEKKKIKDSEKSYLSHVSTSKELFDIQKYYSLPEKNHESGHFSGQMHDDLGKKGKKKISMKDLTKSYLPHVSTSTGPFEIELPYSLPEKKIESDEIDIEKIPIKYLAKSYPPHISTSTDPFEIELPYSLPEKKLESDEIDIEKIPIKDLAKSYPLHVSTSTGPFKIELPYSLPEKKLESDEIDIEKIPIKYLAKSYPPHVSTSTGPFEIELPYSLPEKKIESDEIDIEKIPIKDRAKSYPPHVSTSTGPFPIELPYSLPEKIIQSDEIDIDHFNSESQVHRSFKQAATDIQYKEGLTILPVENAGSASYQCFEFKFVPDELIQKGCEPTISFILKETLRFACGCLNTRKNGTIMFGIGDSKGHYKHGEVVGIEIDKIPGDIREKLASSLVDAIEICFEGHNCRAAAKCIGAPHFVPITCMKKMQKKFVIEFDIEPANIFCKAEIFKINRSLYACAGKDIEKSFTVYVREDHGTKKKVKADEKLFIREMPDIIQKRIDDEKQMILLHPRQSVVSPMDKLRKFLCKGSNKFDKSIWPILVLGKPTNEQKEKEQWVSSLKFIKYFSFHAVFDFDNDSNCDGLCSVYRHPKTSIIQDEKIFEDFSGKKLDLATKLGIPFDMKTVWIFCNGRTDIHPAKPCENKSNWSKLYSAGIRDAVIFYSQNEVIPKGRAVVIVLLFSNNFDGLIETFREVVVRFGWEQIVIIATDSILSRFVTEYVEDEQNIQKCAVSGKGMTWEHINSTFVEIIDCEDQCNVYLPTASGAKVPADEKFVESLNEFHILSAKQCEMKQFKSDNELEVFESQKEENFYRGERVDWYNFHFETHVLKRHCFDRLRNTIDNILKSNSNSNEREKKIVSTVIIAHEPGAGGTTLSRHILWEFHKDFRCAIISKITDRTAKNILSLWQHKESCNAKPILLLIDELLPSDFTLEGLIRQLHMEYRANLNLDGLICCFLVCQRENEMNDAMFDDSMLVDRHGYIVELLKQKLTDEEVNWMDRKYAKLEKNKGLEYKPEYLLPFMIMREGYNQEYIKKTIKGFLGRIDVESNEFELLEYASLLSAYVPTAKRAPTIFIPLECCDQLMGSHVTNTVYWEKNMSYILKIFLIIEQKETASGMQIRMASPMLAKAVLQQVLDNKKECLSALTLRFLECSILQSSSYGKQMVLNFTKTMLVRRLKEEFSDDKTTSFAPLIEAIYEKEHWTNALKVLKMFFGITEDSYVAQILARLCSKFKDFEQAINWADTAVEMSIDAKSLFFSHQIYAVILEEKFIHVRKKVNSVMPTDAVEYVELILSALDHFIVACELGIGPGVAAHILYSIMGVVQSILNCIEFMREKVILSSDVNLRNYFVDQNYQHDEITIWNRLRPKLLKFENEGEKAFSVMEECLCFNTTFYAHDNMSTYSSTKKEHRLYKTGQFRFENYLKEFKSFFGEEKTEMPQLLVPELLNNWHRRRLLYLGGNSYMNICNILQQIRTRSNQFNNDDAIARCDEIKDHLSRITDKTPKDLSNLISVNIVLGLLHVGGNKKDSTKQIMTYCQQILKMRKGYESYAYFFICLLLWPSVEMDFEYDDNLFNESLRNLIRKKAVKQGRSRESKYTYLKEEENITQPTSQFFLKNGKGFDSFCFRADIFVKARGEAEFDPDMWDDITYRHNLKRLTGSLKFYHGKPCILIKNEKSTRNPIIEIKKFRTGRIDDFLREEEVTFLLGFSIKGPIVFNVKLSRHTDRGINQLLDMSSHNNIQKFLEGETVESLQEKMSLIPVLKTKLRDGQNISKEENDIVKNEEEIQLALEAKRRDPLINLC